MYICLCNRFRDAELETAVEKGARSAAEVFEALGVQPQCGGCLDFAEEMVEQALSVRYQKAS